MLKRPLFLHEEVLLLALRDKEGTLHPGAWAQAAIGGAILGELILGGHLHTRRDGKQDVVETVKAKSFHDALLDDCFAKIDASATQRPAQFWAGLFATRGDLIPKTAEGLSQIGVLRKAERKALLLFTRKTYPEVNPRPESALIDRLHAAIFENGRAVDPRTTVLVAVANQTGLLKANFDNQRLATRKSRIESIVNGDFAGEATKDAVQAAHASFFISTMVPLMIMGS